jgi:hypothetical protein
MAEVVQCVGSVKTELLKRWGILRAGTGGGRGSSVVDKGDRLWQPVPDSWPRWRPGTSSPWVRRGLAGGRVAPLVRNRILAFLAGQRVEPGLAMVELGRI